MLRAVVVAVLLLLAGCAGTFGERAHRALPVVNAVTLVASTGAIAWDAYQTRRAATGHWRGYAEVGNAGMILGDRPSVTAVDLYFASMAALNVGAWLAMPERWRSVIPGVVIGGQAYTILGNPSFSCRHVTTADGRPGTECR